MYLTLGKTMAVLLVFRCAVLARMKPTKLLMHFLSIPSPFIFFPLLASCSFYFHNVTMLQLQFVLTIIVFAEPSKDCGSEICRIGLYPYLMKGFTEIPTPLVNFTFNLTLSIHIFPAAWKKAVFFPVFKLIIVIKFILKQQSNTAIMCIKLILFEHRVVT